MTSALVTGWRDGCCSILLREHVTGKPSCLLADAHNGEGGGSGADVIQGNKVLKIVRQDGME